MKKILFSLLVSLCFIPLMVFATIDINTKGEYKLVSADGSTASTWCSGEEANNNSGLDKASSGYYLYCIQITCTSSKNAHSIAHPFASSVTCANGNKDPELTIASSGAPGTAEPSLAEGATCDDTTGTAYAYATEIVYYNCAKTSTGATYVATTDDTNKDDGTDTGNGTNNGTNNGTGTTTTVTSDADKVTNSKTGVKDYYLILGSAIAILSIILYILNKKNIFKKI